MTAEVRPPSIETTGITEAMPARRASDNYFIRDVSPACRPRSRHPADAPQPNPLLVPPVATAQRLLSGRC